MHTGAVSRVGWVYCLGSKTNKKEMSINNNSNNNNFIIEIQRMWNVKAKVIPVIIGTTGTISESLRQYLSNILGRHEIKGLQKTAILGTAHILLEVLM